MSHNCTWWKITPVDLGRKLLRKKHTKRLKTWSFLGPSSIQIDRDEASLETRSAGRNGQRLRWTRSSAERAERRRLVPRRGLPRVVVLEIAGAAHVLARGQRSLVHLAPPLNAEEVFNSRLASRTVGPRIAVRRTDAHSLVSSTVVWQTAQSARSSKCIEQMLVTMRP
jgi:hypothetical protein